jgi:predicted secreted protein
MATISANALGIYKTPDIDWSASSANEPDLTNPLPIIKLSASSVWTASASFSGFDGYWNLIDNVDSVSNNDVAILLDHTGKFVEIVSYKSAPNQAFTFIEEPELMALATSTTIEATNTVNETVARNGQDGSTTYIVGGAMSWSMSIDGLLDLSAAGDGTATSVMDAARDKEYVIVIFDTGSEVKYAGQSLIDSISISGGVDDIATYSASFSGYGDLYKMVV